MWRKVVTNILDTSIQLALHGTCLGVVLRAPCLPGRLQCEPTCPAGEPCHVRREHGVVEGAARQLGSLTCRLGRVAYLLWSEVPEL